MDDTSGFLGGVSTSFGSEQQPASKVTVSSNVSEGLSMVTLDGLIPVTILYLVLLVLVLPSEYSGVPLAAYPLFALSLALVTVLSNSMPRPGRKPSEYEQSG